MRVKEKQARSGGHSCGDYYFYVQACLSLLLIAPPLQSQLHLEVALAIGTLMIVQLFRTER